MRLHRFLVVQALVIASLGAAAFGQDPAVIGRQAAEFTAVDTLNLRPMTNPLKALRGRVVLLIAFETWYPRCLEAVPDMNKLQDKLGPAGLTILGYSEQERSQMEPDVRKHGAKFGIVMVDSATSDEMKRTFPAPAFPHSFLIDADGKIVWQGHPQGLKEAEVRPHLLATRIPAELPPSLAAALALLDDGRWAAARAALLEASGGKLDKVEYGWAKGVAEWIAGRPLKVIDETEALAKAGQWWDAWHAFDDFPRRFEGMDGIDVAQRRAAEIRAAPEAKKDLAAGDDVAKARGLIAQKKGSAAKLILQRVLREGKGTVHAERAKELLAGL